MLRSLKDFFGYTVRAPDGDVGAVTDFYFDPVDWVVRYIAVHVEVDEGERMALLSTRAFAGFGEATEEDIFPVRVERSAVLNSPTLRRAEPISRRHLADIHRYYQWPEDWELGGSSSPGPIEGGMQSFPIVEMMTDVEAQREEQTGGDPRLRSAQEVFGYGINTREGSHAARVEDFIVEDDTWQVMYIVADTAGAITDRLVLLSPSWVEEIDWAEREITMDLKAETIRESPPYDPDAVLDRGYEEQLFQHYQRKGYWTREE